MLCAIAIHTTDYVHADNRPASTTIRTFDHFLSHSVPGVSVFSGENTHRVLFWFYCTVQDSIEFLNEERRRDNVYHSSGCGS